MHQMDRENVSVCHSVHYMYKCHGSRARKSEKAALFLLGCWDHPLHSLGEKEDGADTERGLHLLWADTIAAGLAVVFGGQSLEIVAVCVWRRGGGGVRKSEWKRGEKNSEGGGMNMNDRPVSCLYCVFDYFSTQYCIIHTHTYKTSHLGKSDRFWLPFGGVGCFLHIFQRLFL